MASHSGVKGITDVSRNLSAEELQTIAAKGRVVQVVAIAGYIKKDNAYTSSN